MNDHEEQHPNNPPEELPQTPPPAASADAAPQLPVPGSEPVELHNGHPGTDGAAAESADWHAEAGRKGAQRVHELIRHGRLYEEEHGLKGGRQRLRQLIEEGKLYEQDHGLNATGRKRSRGPRMGSERLLQTLVECLARIAKPAYRRKLTRMLQDLQERLSMEDR
jgi:hypothetical protein